MTTPGEYTVGRPGGPARLGRADDPRDRGHRHARPRRRRPHRRSRRASASTTTCWARSATTGCSTWRSRPTATSRSTSTTPSRTSRSCSESRSRRRSAIAPASIGSARRACPWTRRWPRPSSMSAGRPYAVIDLPFRGERVGALAAPADRARPRIVRADVGDHPPPAGHRPQRPPPGRGGVQVAGAGSARRVRAGSATGGRRLDEGLARMSDEARRPRIAVVDYGAGNLVSIEQALTSVGAEVTVARDAGAARDRRRPRRARRGRRRAGHGAPGATRPRRADPRLDRGRSPVPRDLPRAPAAVRGQRRGRRHDPRRAARPDVAARGRPDAAAHRLEPGGPHPGAPGVRRHRRRRGPVFRPLVRGRARAVGRGRRPRPDRARPLRSCPRSPWAVCSASSSTRNEAARTGCGCSRTSSGSSAPRAAAPAEVAA